MDKNNFTEPSLFDKSEELLDRARINIKRGKKRHLTEIGKVEDRIHKMVENWSKKLKIKKGQRYNYIKNVLSDLILEIFYMDLAKYSVISEMETVFNSEGHDLKTFNNKILDKNMDQFQEIFFVYRFYMAMGMGSYAEDVIHSKILGKPKDFVPDLLSEIKKLSTDKKAVTMESLERMRKSGQASNISRKKA